jgi:hypothetical protein
MIAPMMLSTHRSQRLRRLSTPWPRRAAAFNRKIIDIAQRNVNSGFDLAKSLAGAKNLSDIAEVQAAYWRKTFATLTSQGEEVRALSTMVTAAAAEPIKAHVTNGMEEMRKVQLNGLGSQ